MSLPPSPGPSELNELFPEDLCGPQSLPPDGTFELGLVLGGTVSAGAYSAGVLDFLFEALDCWRTAVANREDVPRHTVTVKALSGTSGGAVCAATAAVLARLNFPHATGATGAINPFFQLWVNTLDINGMLDTGDIGKGPLASVLNVAPIDLAATQITGYQAPLLQSPRDWLAPTLATFITVTNLRGVPYAIDYNGGQQYYSNHADYARFQVQTDNSPPASRPDSFDFDTTNLQNRQTLASFAVASGAFPIGFAARTLDRPLAHYAYRVEETPSSTANKRILRWLPPYWCGMAEPDKTLRDPWSFPAYDGGVIDNQPVELVRTTLAGQFGHNPRQGNLAKRAVVLIDPFAEGVPTGPVATGSVVAMTAALVSAMKLQGRYDSADLALAADPGQFSRFMITARRGQLTGARAIACAGLNAFIGFLCRDFRLHDYMLGRHNAWNYLKTDLTLPQGNPLFSATWWTPKQIIAHQVVTKIGTTELPIIPLVGTAAIQPPMPAWPKGRLDPGRWTPAFKQRFAAVAKALEQDTLPARIDTIFTRLWLAPAVAYGPGKMADLLEKKIQKTLTAWDL